MSTLCVLKLTILYGIILKGNIYLLKLDNVDEISRICCSTVSSRSLRISIAGNGTNLSRLKSFPDFCIRFRLMVEDVSNADLEYVIPFNVERFLLYVVLSGMGALLQYVLN